MSAMSHIVEPNQNVAPGMEMEAAPYLGEVFRIDEGLIQLIRPDKLFSESMQFALYGTATEPG